MGSPVFFKKAGDTAGYFHGRPQEGRNGHCLLTEIGLRTKKILENLKSTSSFSLIDLILAIAFYLPVWH